jgi:hypothetical protein
MHAVTGNTGGLPSGRDDPASVPSGDVSAVRPQQARLSQPPGASRQSVLTFRVRVA